MGYYDLSQRWGDRLYVVSCYLYIHGVNQGLEWSVDLAGSITRAAHRQGQDRRGPHGAAHLLGERRLHRRRYGDRFAGTTAAAGGLVPDLHEKP